MLNKGKKTIYYLNAHILKYKYAFL